MYRIVETFVSIIYSAKEPQMGIFKFLVLSIVFKILRKKVQKLHNLEIPCDINLENSIQYHRKFRKIPIEMLDTVVIA